MAVHASHAALPYPIKNARYTINVPYIDADGDPTNPTTPDTEISKDNGDFADCAEEVAVPTTNRGSGMITFTGAEMDCSLAMVWCGIASGPKATLLQIVPRVLPVLENGTAQAGAAGTITLAAGAAAFDLTGCFVRTTGGTGGGGTGGASNQARKITAYNTSTKVATVTPNWETTPDNTTTYDVLLPEGVTASMVKVLIPTTAGRTLDVSAGGEAGVDWANVGSPTTTVSLTNTTVKPAPVVSGTTTSSGSTTTLIDTGRTEADADYWKECAVHITSGACAGQIRRISAFNQTTDTITVFTPFTQVIASGVTYEILRDSCTALAEALGANSVTASAIADTGRDEIVDAVWDELASEHNLAGSYGERFFTINRGTAQAGAAGSITLDAATASNTVDYYTGCIIVTTAGTGAGQSRYVSGYTTGTRVANVSPNWTTNPDNTTKYIIIPSGRVDIAHWLGSFPSALSSGLVQSTAQGMADNLITAAKIATDALTSVKFEASFYAAIETLIEGQILAYRLDELLAADSDIDGAAPPTVGSVFHELMTKTTGSFTYDQTTDSLEAIKDSGGGAPTAAQVADAVWDEACTDHIASGSFGQRLSILRAGTAQAGAAATITLDASASATDDYYNNSLIVITAGTGAGQARFITNYNGTTKVADVGTWFVNPDATSVFVIVPFDAIPGATAPTASQVADAVWDEARADHVASGSFGQSLQMIRSGTAQAGAAASITLDASASASDGFYKGCIVVITSGTGSGQARQINAYTGSTKVAAVTPNWSTNPDNTSVFMLLPTGRMDIGMWVGDTPSTLSTGLVQTTAPTSAVVADAVWDEATSGHTTVGSFGQTLQRSRTGTAQAGAAGSITLDASANATDAYYAGSIVVITGGTGAGQARLISSYTGSTKVAAVSPNWVTNPSGTSEFMIIPMGRVDVAQWLGSFVNALISGKVDANMQAALDGVLSSAKFGSGYYTTMEGVVRDMLAEIRLNELLAADSDIDGLLPPTVGSVFHELMTKTAGSFTYDQTTDSLEAIRDRGDAAWTGGGAAPTAAEVADAVWDEATSGHTTVGSFGQALQTMRAGTAQAGAASSITLDASANATDAYYAGCFVVITGGTGVGQSRLISSYTGSTKVAAVSPAWTTNPDNTSQFIVVPFGRVDVAQWLGSFVNGLTSGNVNVNVAAVTAAVLTAAKFHSDFFTAINAEALDVVNVDTIPQLSQGIPPATPTTRQALMYLYQWFRNKLTQTATETAMWDDAGTTKIAKATVSNDGTTVEKSEFVSGA